MQANSVKNNVELTTKFEIKRKIFFTIRFPRPQPTDFELIKDIFSDAFSIAVISLTVNVSLAKLYAERYEYDIDINQVIFSIIKTYYLVF